MTRPLPWIKLWLDSLHNQKLIRLSLAERGAWWGLLGLVGELGGYDSDGALASGGAPLTLDEMADSLHIKEADRPHLASMVEKMVKWGSLVWNGGEGGIGSLPEAKIAETPQGVKNPPPYVQRTATGFIVFISWISGLTRCPRCDSLIDPRILTKHHIIPRSRGGPDTLENQELICFNCHRGKHARKKLGRLL